ncbi:MAG: PEP-utilizing enzyme [Anaerolineae bacterium]
MNTTLKTNGTPIVPPPDFPVVWANPDDAQYHWTRDREHMPNPITPMFNSVAALTAPEGLRRIAHVYDEAIVERRYWTINTYSYAHLVPFTGTPEELEARARRNREKVWAVVRQLRRVWEDEWRPALEADWAFWAAFDLEAADLDALAVHLEESLPRVAHLYEIHYLMGPPMWFAIDEFETFYCDLFPGATPLDAHRLLQGFDNKTLEIGRALWRLRDLAQAVPAVSRILIERPAAEVWAALEASAEGQAFLNELRGFLKAYGGRSDLWDWGYPSWEDDPTPVINNLKNYLAQPDRDLRAELTLAAAEREAAIAQARCNLAGYPQPILDRFEQLLDAAQTALVLTENHTYYIDFNGFGWMHRLIGACGKRFAAAGRLNDASDVFYLTLPELRAMLADPTLTHADLAASRRAEAAYWAAYPEPAELGTRPAEPIYLYSPDARRMLRYIGGLIAEAPLPEAEPGQLRGQAGSPGKARGPARVIRSLAEAHRLQPGDILVTTTTAPPWTPLFLTAAAVVTDAGGLLSHGAVVSREYRIPAVVGTRDATARITDGQMLEVDGDRGIVSFI